MPLGDLSVHRLGLGPLRLTGPGGSGQPPDRDECLRVLRRAVDLGVTFIDTAESYGPHVSEEIIAEALYPYPSGLVIGTKAGIDRPTPGEWTPNGRPEVLRRQCEGSLRRLRLDRIDLFQFHRVDPHVPEAEQFGALEALRRDGKIRLVGLSEAGSEVIERARRIVPIASVQNRYNVLDREWEPVLEYCEREGIAFMPWYPLGSGAVSGGAAVARVAGRHGATPMQVALAWLLARSPSMLPIPGTSQVAHLEENMRAASLQLTADDLRELAEVT